MPTAEYDDYWMKLGVCRRPEPGYSDEAWTAVFFEDPGGHYIKAKSLCRACPVRFQCRDWAINNGLDTGVWGGLTPNQRKSYARQHRIVA
jgi:hypothetical protein